MAHINFNLSNLTSREARGLMAMLAVFAEDHDTVAVVTTDNKIRVNAREAEPSQAEVYGHHADLEAAVSDALVMNEATAEIMRNGSFDAVVNPEPTPEPVKAKRGRKPKEASAPVVEEPTPAQGAADEAPTVTIDILRQALQAYTEKHGMSAGIDLLKDFECNRISDMLNLAPELQQEFLVLANA